MKLGKEVEEEEAYYFNFKYIKLLQKVM